MQEDATRIAELVELITLGNDNSLSELFSIYHDRLQRMIDLRLDPSVRSRVDAADILQESYIDASARLDYFRKEYRGSFFMWLRLIVQQRINEAHRRHLGTSKRDAKHQVSLDQGYHSESFSPLANALEGSLTSPSQAVNRNEVKLLVQEVLEGLDPIDREVLLLRHFEQLRNQEISEILGVTVVAASLRYSRALTRFRVAMSKIPGFMDQPAPPRKPQLESSPPV